MSNIAIQKDIGAFLVTKNAFNPQTITAGATEDGNEQTGVVIDRFVGPTSTGGAGGNLQESGQAAVLVSYALTGSAKVTVKSNIEHSSKSSAGFTDLTDKNGSSAASKTFGSTATTSSAVDDDEVRYDLDLAKAKRYIRMQVTATFSGTATDNADIGGAVVLGGHAVVPASTV